MSSKSWKRNTAIGAAEPLPVYRTCFPQLPVAVGVDALLASPPPRPKLPILPNWNWYRRNMLRSSGAVGEATTASEVCGSGSGSGEVGGRWKTFVGGGGGGEAGPDCGTATAEDWATNSRGRRHGTADAWTCCETTTAATRSCRFH